jgi:hypothetical protein
MLRCILVFGSGRIELRENITGCDYVENGVFFEGVGLARERMPTAAERIAEENGPITRVFIEQPPERRPRCL